MWYERAVRVAVTGSEGLLGAALCAALEGRGHALRRLDLRCPEGAGRGDVRDAEAVAALVADVDGVVHLAAVSRVADGEADPARCDDVNRRGTRVLVEAALASPARPWVLLASSREVYGDARALPVTEDAPAAPVNAYGRSKRDAEAELDAARSRGLRAAALRFANVYGSVRDHPRRVVPAFTRAAARGEALRVDGPLRSFDFVHVDDAVRGMLAAAARLGDGDAALPTVHLATGRPTTLAQLAVLANAAGGWRSAMTEGPVQGYDVGSFVGDPARALAAYGWRAAVSVEDGVARMVRDWQRG